MTMARLKFARRMIIHFAECRTSTTTHHHVVPVPITILSTILPVQFELWRKWSAVREPPAARALFRDSDENFRSCHAVGFTIFPVDNMLIFS